MEGTRRMFGHDKPSRHVRDKKTGELVQAKNTIMYHQILAFLPDECDINGGKLTPGGLHGLRQGVHREVLSDS